MSNADVHRKNPAAGHTLQGEHLAGAIVARNTVPKRGAGAQITHGPRVRRDRHGTKWLAPAFTEDVR